MAKEKAKKSVKYLQIPIPEEHYDEALAAFAQQSRGSVVRSIQEQKRQLSPQEADKITNTPDEEVVVSVLKQQILSALERKAQQDALQKLRDSY